MEDMSFAAREMVTGHEAVTLEVDGSLDVNTAGILESTLQDLVMKRNKYRIILNLENLSYISSAGIGVLMRFTQLTRKNHGDILLTHVNHEIYNVFEMLDLTKIFQILKTQQDALGAFGENRFFQSQR